MILHLFQGGSEPIELHIRDGATLFINQAIPSQKLLATNAVGGSRPVLRLVTIALAAVFGVAIGNVVLPHLASGPSRVADLAAPPFRSPATSPLPPVPILPGHIPQSHPHLEEAPPMEVASPAVPAAVTRQLAEQPVVIPAPAQSRTGAGGSAFGLEN